MTIEELKFGIARLGQKASEWKCVVVGDTINQLLSETTDLIGRDLGYVVEAEKIANIPTSKFPIFAVDGVVPPSELVVGEEGKTSVIELIQEVNINLRANYCRKMKQIDPSWSSFTDPVILSKM